MSTSGVERLRRGLSDYWVVGISWVNDEEDLRIHLLPPSKEAAGAVVLRFVWVFEVAIDITFGNLAGAPLLWRTTCSPLSRPPSGWEVDFDFAGAPDGGITFKCNDIVLEEGDTGNPRA